MKIRDAGGEDIPLLAGLIRESFRDVAERFGLTRENCPTHPSLCSEAWIDAAMAKGIRYFILEGEERPCGCVALERAGDEVCYLERLAVLPPYRRKGYGEALVRKAMEEARAAGAPRLEIGIISQQRELVDWYARLGFGEKGRKNFEHLPFEVTFMSYGL
ncbi:MAG: GNAT family N-acetyltransferase [Actinobacteria bacterium]|jgi:N-acetylglutamate synthase-like GNAT family acetyltransferase|nr:MAG: GNAT family N-acetyltransferase [Actinomycetota bacterium]